MARSLTPLLEETKAQNGIGDRTDIVSVVDLIDLYEKRSFRTEGN